MTDEQRLQMITEQLILVRDNLFRGMSKSMQKLQARSINEVLELPNHTQSPQRTWVGLEQEIAIAVLEHCYPPMVVSSDMIERTTEVIKAKLKEKNT
jgi:hypothetical protein